MSSYSIWSEKTWKPCFSWWSSMNSLIRQGRCHSTNFRPTEHLTEQCNFLESTKLFWTVFLSRWKLTFQDNIYPTTGQEPSHNGWITMKTTSVSHHTTPPPPSPHGPAGIFWCCAFFLFVCFCNHYHYNNGNLCGNRNLSQHYNNNEEEEGDHFCFTFGHKNWILVSSTFWL